MDLKDQVQKAVKDEFQRQVYGTDDSSSEQEEEESTED